ncbi:hypothetical protein GCM10020331_066020 [Ectobacillus funiculus]
MGRMAYNCRLPIYCRNADTYFFYLLWLGVGALFGAVAALAAPESLFVQVIAASIVSLLLILGSKRISQHFRMGKGYKDAVDALVGKKQQL